MQDAPSTRLAIRLALARNLAGHEAEAEAGLRDWLTRHPEDLDAERLLSDLEIDARQLAPGAQTADTLGSIMTARQEGDAGVSLLQLATLQAPNQPAMRYHLALAYETAGQPAQAIKLLTPLVADPVDFAEKPKARQLLAALSGAP